MERREVLKCGAALAGLAAGGRLHAQNASAWPSRPVRLVIPFTPGGATDFQGRILCDMLTRAFRQQFYIDYKPGAGSNIGAAEVARSAPDGYTLGWITVASHAINPTLYARLPFDHLRDFAPVSMVAMFPNLLVVNNALPVYTVSDLIALLKREPGKYAFASSGQGTSLHLCGEMFKVMTGTDMLHIPYKGGGPAITDVMGGVVQLTFGNMPTVLAQAKSGKVRPVAVTSAERWFTAPEMQERLASGGARATPMSPLELARFIKEDTERWAPAIRASGARVD